MVDTPATDAVSDLTVGLATVRRFEIQFDFNLYFVVHTKEETNAANDSYTIRGALQWTWNGSGPVTQDAKHAWSLDPTVKSLSSPNMKFIEDKSTTIIDPALFRPSGDAKNPTESANVAIANEKWRQPGQ